MNHRNQKKEEHTHTHTIARAYVGHIRIKNNNNNKTGRVTAIINVYIPVFVVVVCMRRLIQDTDIRVVTDITDGSINEVG